MGQWIKVEKATPDKPELRQIARLCKCSRAEAFLAFFRWLDYADEATSDGFIEFFGPSDIDDQAGLKGFGAALEAVHWIAFNERGAIVSNFQRHNGESAKKRALTNERQSKWRKRVDA